MNKKKFKVNPKIKKLANQFGIEFRVGRTPKDCKIIGVTDFRAVAAYFGEGIIFIRTPIKHSKESMDIICLHEIGHAILDFFNLDIKEIIEENMANGIALAFASQLRLKIPDKIINQFKLYAKRGLEL